MMNKHDQSTESSDIALQLRQVLHNFPFVSLAILFGSLAKNQATFSSDLDLAVQAQRVLTLADKMRLIETLAQQFDRPVDLVDLREVGEPLLGQIITKGRRILGNDTDYGQLIARHLYEEADFMPYRRRILQERRERWIRS